MRYSRFYSENTSQGRRDVKLALSLFSLINQNSESNMTTIKTQYLHIRGRHPRVVTLVHTLESAEDGSKYARVGYAICNCEHDQFVKKLGRTIALGRLQNAKTMLMVNYKPDQTWKQRMETLLGELSCLRHGPEEDLSTQPSRLARTVSQYVVSVD